MGDFERGRRDGYSWGAYGLECCIEAMKVRADAEYCYQWMDRGEEYEHGFWHGITKAVAEAVSEVLAGTAS